MERSATFTFTVQGTGMKSMFKTGDCVKVLRLPPEEVLPGDIIVFLTSWGGIDRPKRLAIHRLMAKKRSKNGDWRLWAKPESRWRLNSPIPGASLLGRVIAVSRDGLPWAELPPRP